MQRFYHIKLSTLSLPYTYIDQTLIRFVMDQCGISPFSEWGRPKAESILALATITQIYLDWVVITKKLGLPERLKYRNTIPVQEHISQKKIGSSYLLELPGLIITRNSCM